MKKLGNNERNTAYGRVLSMAETAILVAIAFVLGYFLSFRIMPQGGAVTVAASIPLMLIGIRRGFLWGLAGAFVYALLQALFDRVILPPASGVGTYVVMMCLDYIIAFSSYALSALFRRQGNALIKSIPVCFGIRFVSHYLSGVILWRSYAWEGWAPELYSAAYQMTYIIPDAIIALVAALLLYKYMPHKYLAPQ